MLDPVTGNLETLSGQYPSGLEIAGSGGAELNNIFFQQPVHVSANDVTALTCAIDPISMALTCNDDARFYLCPYDADGETTYLTFVEDDAMDCQVVPLIVECEITWLN